MSSEKLISKQRCKNTRNEKLVLKYYLTKSSLNSNTYGVKVEKYVLDGRREFLDDYEQVNGVTGNQRQMLNIINTLARNIVTPYTLCEILDDLI